MSRRICLRRREQYRILAARLCAELGVMGMENVDWRALARRPAADRSDNDIARATRWYRALAAPGEMMRVLRTTAAREGVRVHVCAGMGRFFCHACRHEHAPVAPALLVHRCPSCGTLADPHATAALVFCKAALESSGPDLPDDGRCPDGTRP
jgi:hypothetical protein